MTPRDDDRDDLLAALLKAAAEGAPAPDPAFLERLRQQSTDAFLAAANTPPIPDAELNGPVFLSPPSVGESHSSVLSPQSSALSTQYSTKRSPMFTALLRLSAVAIAAALLIAAGLYLWPSHSEAAPLVQVLDRVADAETLHLRVTKDGHTGDAWVAKPNQLRLEEAAGRYQIAQGATLYRIDEKENRAMTSEAVYFRADRPGLDAFGLLGLMTPTVEVLSAVQPERIERDGLKVDLFHLELPARDGTPMKVQAEADVLTGKLRAIEVFADKAGVPQLVAALSVLAEGQPVPEEKFAVSPTLSEDGRVGKVADVQGVVGIKPVLHQRWTPVRPNLLLKPGDWVRADLRGANAALLRLLPQASVIVGPGGLVEVVKPTQVRLHEGEVEITPSKKVPIELLGPGDQKIVLKERTHFRIDNEQLVKVEKPPVWLRGFKGATAEESIGSLVAKVDGRNVPLTVGYHKVSVDVRDQIARTTIEESFVNHTSSQLEGVFHFPLPQDASISGFGMWIGDQLVDADVVEKQRAREIYEQIMREKRDPGLLEWTGGNIFKARVWPIFANSEKRIKITYTQVLPLKDGRYRYSYALQSEMLQQYPLRELSMDVKVHSATPLKSVTSPTHSVRADKTEHSAHLEFSAQEHTPTKDFEVVVETADKVPEVVVVPHRRGSDGYFLVQVTPPAAAAAERDLVADGGPLQLLLVCDTSASIDSGQRAAQRAVAAALLEALTPKDTFNLACCDVNADWAFDKPQPATPENIGKAEGMLAGRVSLGWTDLDRAFDSAIKQAGPKAHVVYLGDGVVTTGDANPQAFAQRLKAMYQASGSSATFHAVALGSAFEPGVLKAIGSLGGGSTRRVTGEQGPAAVALELLGEMTGPPVRDLKVEFTGWKTARVYPEVLPNLVPGTQQILIGRYLPEGQDQQGEVIVSGVQDGKEIKYSAKAVLKDAEAGNSFIPRLWARMHLDKLLELPQSDAIKDDVIALSEEYNIITPYTSFLVLESDADRERFKVKRRFQMRDGEQFFAQGRDNADYELARAQMKRAGDWRTGLRRQVLAGLYNLGRDIRMLDPRNQYEVYPRKEMAAGTSGGFGGRFSGGFDDFGAHGSRTPLDELERRKDSVEIFDSREKERPESSESSPRSEEPRDLTPAAEPDQPGSAEEDKAEMAGEQAARESAIRDLEDFAGEKDFKRLPDFERGSMGRGFGPMGPGAAPYAGLALGKKPYMDRLIANNPYGQSYTPTRWFDGLFPTLPGPAARAARPQSNWPQEARDLARLLLRREALAKIQGGLRIERQTESFNTRDNALSGRERRLELYSPSGWATRTDADNSQSFVEWCDGKERAIFGTAFQLGRSRSAVEGDLREPPLYLYDHSLTPLDESYPSMIATVQKADGESVLVLKDAANQREIRVHIDTTKRAVTKAEHFNNNKLSSKTTYADFVEVGGSWWPSKAETTGPDGRPSIRITQTVTALNADDFSAQVKQVAAGRDAVPFLRSPEPTVAEAKKANAAGKSSFDERFALLNHYAGYQQWAKAGEQLEGLEKLTAGKPGVRWLRTVFLQASRRGEELRKRMLDEAAELLKMPAGGDRLALADFVYGQASPVLAGNELLALLDQLRPIYADQPQHVEGLKRWKQKRVAALRDRAGRPDEALALQKALAAEYPRDFLTQYEYAQALFQRGEHEAAFAFVQKHLAPGAGWSVSDAETLRGLYADWLEQLGRYPALVDLLADWVKLDPESESPYHRYLSALIRAGEQEKAYTLIGQWLKEAQVKGEVAPPLRARFAAAAGTALGRGHNLYTDRLDQRWLKPLGEAGLFFADQPKSYNLADHILAQWQFQQTDEGRQARAQLFDRVVRQLGDLPTPRLIHLLALVMYGPPEADKAAWAKVATELKVRWSNTSDQSLKHQLGASLGQVLSARVGADEYLDFLRLQWKAGPETHRPEYAATLFDTLLSREWSAERENESIALLPKLGDFNQPETRLQTVVLALHRLTDRMVLARYESARKDIEQPEKLTRVELLKKQAELLQKARTGYAERLAKAEGEGIEKRPWLNPWLKAERLFLLARADADPKALAVEVWQFLGDAPAVRTQPAEPSDALPLDEILLDRHLTMALYLAAQRGAAPELVARTLKYLDAGIAAEPDEPAWKAAKLRLLVALDRPKELEAALNDWLKAGDADGRWRTALGYLLAEQGRLKEAIALFEGVEKSDELSYSAYQALAGWYMAVNQREAHERALVSAFKIVDEYALSRVLAAKLYPWQRGGGHVPTELDKDVVRIFAALFEKASYPQNYLGQLQQFYTACRDFRLLAVMCDSVVGQSAGKIYPFLSGMQGVLNELRDEAAADEMLAHIEKLRSSAKTPTDLRALDLLEMQVRRRAAELLNQPGPHAEKALLAMKRAYERPWAEGEPLMVSNLLRDLGHITREDLAQEQLRELKKLYAPANAGTFERMHMAHNYANALGSYSRYREAIDLLHNALDEFAAAHDGILPTDADNALLTLVSFHESVREPAAAEELLQGLIKKSGNTQQALWRALRLDELYLRTLQGDGTVSLGTGKQLYQALEARIINEAQTDDSNQRYQLFSLLCSVYRTARDKKFPNFTDDLKAFAHQKLPPLLKKQTTNYDSIVQTIASTVHDLVDAREAVLFFVERFEDEPAWLALNNQDGWSRHGWMLAQWRSEAPALGRALEERLLKLVLAQLRTDLRTQREHNRYMYWAGHNWYWSQKESDFARVADEVYEERKKSGSAMQYIAQYLYHGCNRQARAIDVLLAAYGDKLLDDAGQILLVSFLHGQNRYDESIPLLLPLVERTPDNPHYRMLLCRAYFHTGRQAELRATFAAAEQYFRDKSRWNEGTMSTLAPHAVYCQLFERAVVIYGELIPLHQRTHPNRGIGNGTLSNYYQYLASAYSGLGRTMEAIDAASGAVVSWGGHIGNRTEALRSLQHVVDSAPNLDKVVEQLDAQTGETGLMNPLVRKAVGQAYFNKGNYFPAIAQLQTALSAQPNDAETLQRLIDCYDRMQNAEGAVAQVLRALELSRRDIKRYEDLGGRFEALGKPAEAERAYTSVVEVLPNESEGHELLAQIRQRQGRWGDAINQWQEVAKIRALEPNGLLGLAAAQLHEKQFDKASETIAKLKARPWPPHFSDAPSRIAELERQLRDGMKR
jgi:predicted Zn-dependent protease